MLKFLNKSFVDLKIGRKRPGRSLGIAYGANNGGQGRQRPSVNMEIWIDLAGWGKCVDEESKKNYPWSRTWKRM